MQTCLYAIGVDLYFSYKKPLPRGSRKKLSAAVQRACTPHASHCQACNPHLQRFPALARTQSPRVYSLKIVYLETLHQSGGGGGEWEVSAVQNVIILSRQDVLNCNSAPIVLHSFRLTRQRNTKFRS